MDRIRICALLLALLTLILSACSGGVIDESAMGSASAPTGETTGAETVSPEPPPVECDVDVRSVGQNGDVFLGVSPSDLYARGFALWDVIKVSLKDHPNAKTFDMPLCLEESDVSFGKKYIRAPEETSAGQETRAAVLSVNEGSFAEESRWAEVAFNDAGEWVGGHITLTLKTPSGYFETWLKRTLKRSDKREDYAELSDEQYANFRAVQTTGMGANKLYRSSSPVNPSYNRAKEADAAARAAGIATVLDLTDAPGRAEKYAGYKDTYCSGLPAFTKQLEMDFLSETFAKDVSEALRFLISHDAPYLVHCMEGKDRTGFVCALLEAFAGAGADEIVEDYMLSYVNFYKVEPGSERYRSIARVNIEKTLAAAFEVPSIRQAELKTCAGNYLKKIGLTDEEIALLRTKLS